MAQKDMATRGASTVVVVATIVSLLGIAAVGARVLSADGAPSTLR